jgi:hypothetical protein
MAMLLTGSSFQVLDTRETLINSVCPRIKYGAGSEPVEGHVG